MMLYTADVCVRSHDHTIGAERLCHCEAGVLTLIHSIVIKFHVKSILNPRLLFTGASSAIYQY